MPQSEKTETSSSKQAPKKSTPLSVSERKMRSVSRKRETHKALNVFIQNSVKESLDTFCLENGLTQAEAIELLIKKELSCE